MRQCAEEHPDTEDNICDLDNLERHSDEIIIDGRCLCLIFTLEYHSDGAVFWHLTVSFMDKEKVPNEVCLQLCAAFFESDESGKIDVEETPSELAYMRNFWQPHKTN